MTQVVIEVTNTLSIDFTTGIQRVVREVVNGLRRPRRRGSGGRARRDARRWAPTTDA